MTLNSEFDPKQSLKFQGATFRLIKNCPKVEAAVKNWFSLSKSKKTTKWNYNLYHFVSKRLFRRSSRFNNQFNVLKLTSSIKFVFLRFETFRVKNSHLTATWFLYLWAKGRFFAIIFTYDQPETHSKFLDPNFGAIKNERKIVLKVWPEVRRIWRIVIKLVIVLNSLSLNLSFRHIGEKSTRPY